MEIMSEGKESYEVFCEGCSSRSAITEGDISVVSPEKGKHLLEAHCPKCAESLDLSKWLPDEDNLRILKTKISTRPRLCPRCRSYLITREDIISQFGECLVCKYTTRQEA